MKKLFSLLILLALPVSLSAQRPAPAQIEEMKRLQFLVGQWQGTGWNEFVPGQRGTAMVTETVQSKLDGTVLLLEGLGKAKIGGKGEEVVVHNALGVLSYDPQAKQYRLRSYLSDGRSVDAAAKFVGDAFEWGFEIPRMGTIRYNIKLTDKGEWFETGEMSQDGKTWRKIHEMTLRRVK